MNFLSHFYFDRHSEDPNLVLGAVLPDLVKNACKDWNLHPEKNEHLFASNPEKAILEGWKKHLKVDRHFHNSNFFIVHTREIKKAIIPALSNSVVRPSFLAHIALELMLDSTLLTEEHVKTHEFYDHLRKADPTTLRRFLESNNLGDTKRFFIFFNKFIENQYLESYRQRRNVMYAIQRICMRIWDDPLSEQELIELSKILYDYHQNLMGNYMDIYDEIHQSLSEN